MALKILYLAHDLTDAAVRRRVLMLKLGGAHVTVAGFQRAENTLAGDGDVTTIFLGRTVDGRFVQRLQAVLSAAMSLKKDLKNVPEPDVIVARNLEMLALADRASKKFGAKVPVIYECLDIHRLLLNDGLKGRMLRAAEGFFGRDIKLIITSSPAFIDNYFSRRSKVAAPTLLLENKVLVRGNPAAIPLPKPRPPGVGRPWKIGWFGAIRCSKSLAILSEFARRMEGKVEVIIRGRPSHGEFDNFSRQVALAPYVEFGGPYRNPEDLEAIYSDVQFAWAVDFFEEGLNSEWLLPNRLYESALHGAIPVALKSTETGKFLERRGLGLVLEAVTPDDLETPFKAMDDNFYERLFNAMAGAERRLWVAGAEECRSLVAHLGMFDAKGISSPSEVTTSHVKP